MNNTTLPNTLCEKRIFLQIFVLLFVCVLISFSQLAILTKMLILINFILFSIIFILHGINFFSSYFLFYIVSALYITLRYLIIPIDENVLDIVLGYFSIIVLIITLFSSISKKISFTYLQKIKLRTAKSYKKGLLIFGFLYLLLYFFLIGQNVTNLNPTEIIAQSILLRKQISSGATLYLYQLLQFLSYMVLLLSILIDYQNEQKTKYRLYSIIIILLLCLPLGSRGAVVYNIVYYLLYDFFLFRKINLLKLSFIGLVCISFTAWYGKARSNETNVDTNEAMQYVFSRFDAIDNYAQVYPYMKQDINIGASVYNLALQPIPRTLMPQKPYLFNTFLTEKYFPSSFMADVTYDFSAIPEALYNFGILGIFLLGTYLGFVFKLLSDLLYFVKKQKMVVGAIVYCNFFMYPLFVFIVGWINSGTSIAIINSIISTIITVQIIKAKR
jgi:oligosaccharide repeat unit polymerase